MFCNRQNPAVGDGNLMGVSSKIFNGVSKAVESLFDIQTPCFFIKLIPEFRPVVRIPKFRTERGKMKLTLFIKRVQFMQIFAFEFIPENFNRNKKLIFYFPEFMIRS